MRAQWTISLIAMAGIRMQLDVKYVDNIVEQTVAPSPSPVIVS
jgi:hypothetical protein